MDELLDEEAVALAHGAETAVDGVDALIPSEVTQLDHRVVSEQGAALVVMAFVQAGVVAVPQAADVLDIFQALDALFQGHDISTSCPAAILAAMSARQAANSSPLQASCLPIA